MSRISPPVGQRDGFSKYPPPLLPPSSISTPYGSDYENESTPSSSFGRISPVLLLVIVIVAVIFFVSGLLHLLVRFFNKTPSFSPIFHSNRYPETPGSHSLQRQLQQLFRLHDSGLDQSVIDALPVFFYKDIMGLKEPFDCAVCLCEFAQQDKLRLLPNCSHAFHIHCIDTWLLSNSTCPLCRGIIVGSNLPLEYPIFNFDVTRELSDSNRCPSDGENVFSSGLKSVIKEESNGEKRVFSVRLGKFRSLNVVEDGGERRQGETSSCNLDARRCYSMGTFQYVVVDSDLQVTLFHDGGDYGKFGKIRGDHGCSSVCGDVEGKKISGRSKGESFSVSKIWQWSKKSRFPGSLNTQMGAPSTFNVSLRPSDRNQIV